MAIATTDAERFSRLQARFCELWPSLTPRTDLRTKRTVVVIQSLNIELPPHLTPVLPAYEERFLCLVLTLLRAPESRVVYVTSLPILPRIIDYYLEMVPDLTTEDLRNRLTCISVVDGSARPLSEKLLARPHAVERIRAAIPDPERAFIVPFNVTEREVELAVRLGVPVYGPDPSFEELGTKSGSRRLFREEGVPHPAGVEGVATPDDVIEAVATIRGEAPATTSVVVKQDAAAGGLGNALLSVADATSAEQLRAGLRPDDPGVSVEAFLAGLALQGGIVEERITGAEIRSPSVQMRVSPTGEAEILSTHDQILGGETGLTFLGCTFPADPSYALQISEEAAKIGRRLGREGVIGRFAIDFVVVRDPDEAWRPYAIEINLRNGGTTHPLLTLQALTDGEYDPEEGEFHAGDGRRKYYMASDHLEDPSYAQLTPDDVLDLVPIGLGWDPATQTGMAFHLISAVAVSGRMGVTAIGDTREEARALYARAKRMLAAAVRKDSELEE